MLFDWYYNNRNIILLQSYREKLSNDLISNLLGTPYSLLLRGDITKGNANENDCYYAEMWLYAKAIYFTTNYKNKLQIWGQIIHTNKNILFCIKIYRPLEKKTIVEVHILHINFLITPLLKKCVQE